MQIDKTLDFIQNKIDHLNKFKPPKFSGIIEKINAEVLSLDLINIFNSKNFDLTPNLAKILKLKSLSFISNLASVSSQDFNRSLLLLAPITNSLSEDELSSSMKIFNLEFVEQEERDEELINYFIFRVETLHFYQQYKVQEMNSQKSNVQEVFESLSVPCAVFIDNELEFFNSQFSKLNITSSSSLNYADGSFISSNNDQYIVKKKTVSSSIQCIILIKNERGNKNSKELGIVASSIAHELNNPIAGILLSLNYLETLDIEQNIQSTLNEMTDAVKRCKSLIDVFLGFSKVDISNIDKNNLDLAVSIEQAYKLAKSRVALATQSIRYEHHELEKFQESLNSSIVTMIFYILFNECITFESHQGLIKGHQISDIQFKIKEYRNEIEITSTTLIKTNNQLESNKLFKDLLLLEKLEYRFLENGLRIWK